MLATFDIKEARNTISKTAKRRLSRWKRKARGTYRHRLKHSDSKTEFDGRVKPTFTGYYIC